MTRFTPSRRPLAQATAGLVLMLAAPLSAATTQPSLGRDVEPRVNQALAYLARQQKPDGSFDDGGNPPASTALTGLSLLAFLSAGHMPDQGRHGLVVRGALDYLLKQSQEGEAYLGRSQGSRLYGHAIATLALAEVYGNESDPAQRRTVREALEKSVAVLLRAQQAKKSQVSHEGGWRYEPESDDSDLSVTAWCALAIRGAQNAALRVPDESPRRAVAFVLNCHNPQTGGFAYQPGSGPSASMTGAAVLTLCLLDAADKPQVRDAAVYLQKNLVDERTKYFSYSLYYTTQAAFQLGGATWDAIWRNTVQQLAQRQLADGSFRPAAPEPGRVLDRDHAVAVYATSMGVLTLTVPYRLLPIYQK